MALAPPGIDELYALSALGETLAEARFRTLVVDPAPTGHLLRLLEMPALALDWSHRLLRLMLKYRDVVGLGDAAQELLAFARRTRAFAELLGEPARAGLLVVALDEPLVRAETVRLVAEVRRRGVDVMGLLWNRVAAPPAPLSVAPAVAQFAAGAAEPPPRGPDALRRWRAEWTPLAAGV
jgi:arsenite-transporting ATPase